MYSIKMSRFSPADQENRAMNEETFTRAVITCPARWHEIGGERSTRQRQLRNESQEQETSAGATDISSWRRFCGRGTRRNSSVARELSWKSVWTSVDLARSASPRETVITVAVSRKALDCFSSIVPPASRMNPAASPALRLALPRRGDRNWPAVAIEANSIG